MMPVDTSLRDVDVEALLSRALTPVDPPEDLAAHLQQTLTSIADLAEQELEAWELSAMHDPKNWIAGFTRPVVAGALGATAGAALVVLRVRKHVRT